VALVLVGGIPVAACSMDERATSEQSSLAAELSPCDGVSLDARRSYHPPRFANGHAVAQGALTFAIPDTIPVTLGAAGHGKVTLTYRSGSGAPTTCVYRGDDSNRHRGRYIFTRCAVRSALHDNHDDEDHSDVVDSDVCDGAAVPVAGSIVSADTFTLHIVGGDRRFPATGVHVSLAGPVDTASCRGKANFHDRTLARLGGNGRACSDCHMDSQSFQLTPAAALARYVEMNQSGIDDPLFRPIDADDFRTNGADAHDYTNLIENGLVRVAIPLPSNVKLLDCGSTIPCPASARPTSESVADVWRAVPSIFDVAITGPDGVGPVSPRGPNQRGGYQHDGRIDTLQNQALGALRDHASITADPPARWLDDVAVFQSTQFSSPRVKSLSDAMAAGTSPLPDPDPVLDGPEAQGKIVFHRACAQCHGNLDGHPSGSTPILQGTPGTPTAMIRYHFIFSACPRPVDTVTPPRFSFAPCSASQMGNVRTYEITNSGVAPEGTPCGGPAPQPPCVTRVTTSEPGRMLLTGYPVPAGPGDIEHLDTPSLRGISRTAPYFSNNTAATLEDVVEHYKQFFKRVAILAPAASFLTTQPGVVPPVHDRPFSDAEIPALLAYLRKI
jgi:cytochrome c peroxidase